MNDALHSDLDKDIGEQRILILPALVIIQEFNSSLVDVVDLLRIISTRFEDLLTCFLDLLIVNLLAIQVFQDLMVERGIFHFRIIGVNGDINNLTRLVVRDVTFTTAGQGIIFEFAQKLFFAQSTFCCNFTSSEFSDVRERFVVIFCTIQIQKELIVVHANRNLIDFDAIHLIPHTFGNDGSIFGCGGICHIHNMYVLTITVVHSVIIRTRLLHNGALRNLGTNFQTIHVVVVVFVTKDFCQGFTVSTFPHFVIVVFLVIYEEDVSCRMIKDILKLNHFVYDNVITFCLFVTTRVTTNDILAIGKDAREIRIQKIDGLTSMRCKHDRSHRRVVLGNAKHSHSDQAIGTL